MAVHSLGGLVTRGLLSLNKKFSEKIRSVFFMGVPFYGSPKAEYLYLTGVESGLNKPIDFELMRQLAPNLPVSYFLAPNNGYVRCLQSDDEECKKYLKRSDGSMPAFVDEEIKWGLEDRVARLKMAERRGVYSVFSKEVYDFPERVQYIKDKLGLKDDIGFPELMKFLKNKNENIETLMQSTEQKDKDFVEKLKKLYSAETPGIIQSGLLDDIYAFLRFYGKEKKDNEDGYKAIEVLSKQDYVRPPLTFKDNLYRLSNEYYEDCKSGFEKNCKKTTIHSLYSDAHDSYSGVNIPTVDMDALIVNSLTENEKNAFVSKALEVKNYEYLTIGAFANQFDTTELQSKVKKLFDIYSDTDDFVLRLLSIFDGYDVCGFQIGVLLVGEDEGDYNERDILSAFVILIDAVDKIETSKLYMVPREKSIIFKTLNFVNSFAIGDRKNLSGDDTVPTISQVGLYLDHKEMMNVNKPVRIEDEDPENLKHTREVDRPFVWEHIVNSVTDPDNYLYVNKDD